MTISSLQISPLRLLPAIVGALLLLPLLQGCGGRSRVHADLLHAESIMEEHPDSAYDILSAMRVDSAASEEDRALHALLLTQAMHKTHRLMEDGIVPISTADSMIRIAEEYFERGNDTQRLMLVYYYRGVILALTPDNFSAALLPLTKSLELARSLDDSFWIAQNYDIMGDVFCKGDALKDMVEASREALRYYMLSGRSKFIPWARMSLARAQVSISLNEDAIESILPVVNDTAVDRYLMGQAKETLARAYFFSDRYRECLDEINSIDSLEETMESEHPELPVFIVGCYLEMDSLGKARALYDRYKPIMGDLDHSILEKRFAWKEDNVLDTVNLQRMFDKMMGEYEKSVSTDLNSVLMKASMELQDRNRRLQERQSRIIVTFSCIALIIVALVIVIYIRKRRLSRERNQFRLENENFRAENDSVKREIVSYKEEIEKVKELVTEYSDTILKLQKEIEKKPSHSHALQKDLLDLLQKDRNALNDLLTFYYK